MITGDGAAIIAAITLAHGAAIYIPTFFWSLGMMGVDPQVYRLVWWGLGHSSQQINVAAMVAIWYLLGALTVGAVVVENTLNPLLSNQPVRTVGEKIRILARDADLVVKTIRYPTLNLFATQFAVVHHHLKRVVNVVAVAQRAQASLEFVARPGRLWFCHSVICMPSSATSML